ncbi:2,3-dihydro-2,3-dihydroxybenzoate dehydrogenase [Kibdelosporangium phytohabitans]|uniref:2,3-dihydro-2,3-dihydroxybenzoate dehydrogenase n=1 Tax=Kibdelosporangium phytohabitans TaxID=860235 RepID=A0A0N9I2A5_9PSEU|nr:2,3-dihydro-2,3-dihydroxybenzoate dehydrogenase [Kibdelosporangium phytohabitans]ALG08569.1 2,3-dihydro-2,3-dihydroxybenzoate dehydrogenase [Kibdelosporangium phytohabitans]MBE1470352.1 2,3-dihydro-2,3-dihydroxybenzoate dehydrogenase [Kibdelosporangium phytohabitans]
MTDKDTAVSDDTGIVDKVAVVTGGAGGIGTAIAWALARRGAAVAVVDTDEGRLAELTGKLVAEGLTAQGFTADVTDARQVALAVDRIEAELGPIDLLVNAAGVLRMGSATDLSEVDWQTTFSVNLNGVFHSARAVVPRMKQRRRGSIVTVASNAARVPRVHMAAYGASKAAAASYTKTLGLELAEYGIRCNVVSPGSTDTDMLRLLWSGENDRQATIDGSAATYKTGIPLRRIADPGDIAEAVVFLASDSARHITMQDLCVDGGAVLGV